MPIFVGSDNILATQEYYMRKPARWFQLLAEHKVELTFTTNAAIAVSLRSIKRLYGQENINLSHLNLYITAEKISATILRKTRERLAPLGLSSGQIHSAYGMAENALGASISRTDKTYILRIAVNDDNKILIVDESYANSLELVSVGPAHINHTFSIRNDLDNILPELYLGEINIESDCLTPGYLNQPEITKEKLADGRFRTGDLGFLHNGLLYFYGRKDDLMIYNGRNIVPEDIEETVENLEFVRHSASAIFAWENTMTGLMGLHLVVEGNASDSPQLNFEKECVIRETVAEKHDVTLTKVYFCSKGSIEKTSSGKKRRKVVKKRLLSGTLDIFKSEEESLYA
jgi:fatty-acyl-CoA synthase